MKHSGKTFVCVISSFALAFGAKAITGDPGIVRHGQSHSSYSSATDADDTSYEAIVKRNVFDLKEPDRNSVVPPPNAPPSNVALTGIMTIFGKKQALFMVQKQASPGRTADAGESCILSEGQRQGGLELLAIDQKGAKVTIRNDGVVSTITFEASKPTTAAAPANPTFPPRMPRSGFRPNLNPTAVAPPPLPVP